MSKIQCLTCGGMAELGDEISGDCPYCGCRVEYKRISSFNGVRKSDFGNIRKLFESAAQGSGKQEPLPKEKSDLALALCYLLAGNFVLAKKTLSRIIENDPANAEPYYYYALTLVNGRSLSEINMAEAREISGCLKTAMAFDDDFVFPKLFYALLCIEYYEANDLRAPENGYALLEVAAETEVDSKELEFFKSAVDTNIL